MYICMYVYTHTHTLIYCISGLVQGVLTTFHLILTPTLRGRYYPHVCQVRNMRLRKVRLGSKTQN